MTTPTDTSHTPPVGTVQRSTLNVAVTIDPVYAATASSAGVTVNELTVRVQRAASTDAALMATTNAAGITQFTGLLEGTYQVSIDRALSAAELAKLPAGARDARSFSGAATVTVAPPQTAGTSIQLVAPERGSLVISEIYMYNPSAPVNYSYGTYLEVYNNSDSTIALDGMLVLRTSGLMGAPSSWATCEQLQTFKQGDLLWAVTVWAFPGSGREYLVRPGEAKVVATDAIDHRVASPETNQQDLSRADFEIIGAADIDNPYSPNMTNISPVGFNPRGVSFGSPASYALALPSGQGHLEYRDFVRADNPSVLTHLLGVPAEAVIDVASVDFTPAYRATWGAYFGLGPNCENWLAPKFELGVALLGDGDINLAMSRKSLGSSASGHDILQRTHYSSRDFEYHQPLLRSLKKP